jgi:hypothetical protein
MGIKSRYKQKLAEEIPASEKIKVEPAAENPAVVLATEEMAKADEATERLRKQLHDLRQAEAFQQRATMQQRPMNHTEKLAAWKAGGMSDGDHDFLATNPDMVEHDRITAAAAHQAAQEGHERNTDSHRQRTRELFDQHLRQTHAQAPTPEFFQPKPAPESAPESERAAIYSAPPSREVPSGGSRQPSPSSVRLTPEELQIAAASGISATQYAKNKLEMLRKQNTGEIQK